MARGPSVVERAFAAALHPAPGPRSRTDRPGRSRSRRPRRQDGDAGLDAGAALLAARAADRTEAFRRGTAFVRGTWERGWQPADLVRSVRRGLGADHVHLAAALITEETRRYGDALPPRWRAQLDALPAGDPPADPFLYATALLELYRLLLALPALEPVGPVPGTPAHVPPAHPVPRTARTPARIRALLAKAEATGYPAEAEALTAKAQDLMARHSIDAAALAGHDPDPDAPVAVRIGVEAPYESAQAILLDAVAGANRCRAVWNEQCGLSTVVGHPGDLQAVELLYASLLVQGTEAMTVAEAAERAAGRRRTKTFRQSFLLAYADRLGRRLADTARRATEAADDGLLPVLASRDAAVTAHADELFPSTTASRVRMPDDPAGRHGGTRAADRAAGI